MGYTANYFMADQPLFLTESFDTLKNHTNPLLHPICILYAGPVYYYILSRHNFLWKEPR